MTEDTKRFYRDMGFNIYHHRQLAPGLAGRSLSQEALGLRVGLTRAHISNIEAGRQRLSAHQVARFAAELNVPVSDLYPR